jgi:N-acetylglucosamine transport system permease protein
MKGLAGRKKKEKMFLACCVAPALIGFCIFILYPAIQVFRMSLYKWSGGTGKKTFIGLDNFTTLFANKSFQLAFRNTVFLMVFVTIVTMAFSLFFAAVISRGKLKEGNFYRVVLFFPNVLSIVVIGIIFKNLFNPVTGIVNSALKGLGMASPPNWFGDSRYVLWVIALAMIWQAVGYYMVMYIAGMDGISPELYEVSDLEGANRLQEFFKITLPLIWPTVRTTLVFFILSTMNMSFQFVTVMTNGEPQGASEVLLSYVNLQAFSNANFGYAMSVSVVVFLFSFVLAILAQVLTARKEK